MRPFCPTRWTAKAKSFESVLHNCRTLLETLLSISVVNDGVMCLEVTTKASGIPAKLEAFGLFFSIAVCTKFIRKWISCRDIIATKAKKCAEVLYGMVYCFIRLSQQAEAS